MKFGVVLLLLFAACVHGESIVRRRRHHHVHGAHEQVDSSVTLDDVLDTITLGDIFTLDDPDPFGADDGHLQAEISDDEADMTSEDSFLETSASVRTFPSPPSSLQLSWRNYRFKSEKNDEKSWVALNRIRAQIAAEHATSMEQLRRQASIADQKLVRIQQNMQTPYLTLMEQSATFRKFYIRMLGVLISVLADNRLLFIANDQYSMEQDATKRLQAADAVLDRLIEASNDHKSFVKVVYCVLQSWSTTDRDLKDCADKTAQTLNEKSSDDMGKFTKAQYFRNEFVSQSRFTDEAKPALPQRLGVQVDDDPTKVDPIEVAIFEVIASWQLLADNEEQKALYAGIKGWGNYVKVSNLLNQQKSGTLSSDDKKKLDALIKADNGLADPALGNYRLFTNTWDAYQFAMDRATSTLTTVGTIYKSLNPTSSGLYDSFTTIGTTLMKPVWDTVKWGATSNSDARAHYRRQRSKFATDMIALLKETTEKTIGDGKKGLSEKHAFDVAIQVFLQYGMSLPVWSSTDLAAMCTTPRGCLFQAIATLSQNLMDDGSPYKSAEVINTRLDFFAKRKFITKSAEFAMTRAMVIAVLRDPTSALGTEQWPYLRAVLGQDMTWGELIALPITGTVGLGKWLLSKLVHPADSIYGLIADQWLGARPIVFGTIQAVKWVGTSRPMRCIGNFAVKCCRLCWKGQDYVDQKQQALQDNIAKIVGVAKAVFPETWGERTTRLNPPQAPQILVVPNNQNGQSVSQILSSVSSSQSSSQSSIQSGSDDSLSAIPNERFCQCDNQSP